MKNPYLAELDVVLAPELPKIELCLACQSPVRRSHILTEITVYLDALPHRKGTYYYENDTGLVFEDQTGYVREDKYRRHRCSKWVA